MEPLSFYKVSNEAAGEAIGLLKQLISISSVSKEEQNTGDLLEQYFKGKEIPVQRIKNNIIVRNKYFNAARPVILLNSHHDTVKPNKSWTLDPFKPVVKDGKLYGLGTNDAGAPLVSLILTFLAFYEVKDLSFNVILALTAEEEISGKNGIELILPELPEIDFAVVGEPTGLEMAVAEKGLIVLDCSSRGKAGHAARDEGDNAIYNAIKDVEWFRAFQFRKTSEMLGNVKMTVTQIKSGSQHNVVPDICDFVVDIRSTDLYTNEEILDLVRKHIVSDVKPRSLRLQSSGLPQDHKLIRVASELGLVTYGSPTLSDMALMPFPSVKIGPGKSERSHTADEYIELEEIGLGIDLYIKYLLKVMA